MYYGDIDLEDVLDFKFTTVDSTGAPSTLTGSGSILCYVGNSTTELTAGLTLTRAFDSRTGLNNVRVTATAANGYSLSQNYQVVIKGTVNAVSVTGYVVGEFSIACRSALKPTTAKRMLDVSAGGEAGVDWANVGSPTTTVDLSGTTIKTTQKVDVDTIKTNAVVNGGTLTFPTNATLASTTNITAGTITTVGTLTTYTGNTPQTGDVYALANGASGFAAIAGYIDTEVAAIKAKTDNLPAAPAAVGDAMTLTSAYNFAKGTVAVTESYSADGAAPTPVQALMLILQMLTDKSVTSTTLTVNKLDGSTAAATFTLDSSSSPTSITRAT